MVLLHSICLFCLNW